jgi:hypothetical protein
MSDEPSALSDYVAVPKFLADTGMKKSLIYDLLRRGGALDGFQLDGTRKWVIHRNALEVMRRQRLREQVAPERQESIRAGHHGTGAGTSQNPTPVPCSRRQTTRPPVFHAGRRTSKRDFVCI